MPFKLKVEAGATTRVTVEADTHRVFEGTMKAGEDRIFTARDKIQISADDAGALLLELNGKILGDVLREEIRSGLSTQERKIAICTGAASLPPEERIEILTLLAADSDEIVREKAAGTLLTQPLANVMAALARTDAAPEMFAYCAAEFSRRPGVADALAKNPTCPIEVLRPVVRYLSVTAVQDLFEDLDRLSTSPALVAALIESSVVNAEQHDQLLELQREEPEGIEALLEAAEIAEPDAAKRETLLQKISRLRVVERVQMAMKGTREARGVLIRDSCKVVQRAVLQSPQLTAREVAAPGFASLAPDHHSPRPQNPDDQ